MSLPAGIDSIVTPCSAGSSTCGYCSPPGQRSETESSYHSATLQAYFLSSSVYQAMIDRGWRRSGQYCYKPDLRISCCPQYTIRLDVSQFTPSRSQRKLLNRWNRYVLHGEKDPASMDVSATTSQSKPSKSGKQAHKSPTYTSLSAVIHEAESGFHREAEPAHTFTVELEPSSFTTEKFELYQKYQAEIHHDPKNSPAGFKRFLVDSPLNVEPIPYPSEPPSHLPKKYGSYHQLYRIDGQLVAIGVLDILPSCVSSVYFMYDKNWEKYSMGKISALRETSLAREMKEAGAPGMGFLYMGFYIHSCPKMRYKGDYAPSYLADPETHEWYPLESCTPSLDKQRYACFSDPSHSSADNEDLEEIAKTSEVPTLSAGSPEFDDVKIIARSQNRKLVTVPVTATGFLSSVQIREDLGSCIRGLGHEIVNKVVFNL